MKDLTVAERSVGERVCSLVDWTADLKAEEKAALTGL